MEKFRIEDYLENVKIYRKEDGKILLERDSFVKMVKNFIKKEYWNCCAVGESKIVWGGYYYKQDLKNSELTKEQCQEFIKRLSYQIEFFHAVLPFSEIINDEIDERIAEKLKSQEAILKKVQQRYKLLQNLIELPECFYSEND